MSPLVLWRRFKSLWNVFDNWSVGNLGGFRFRLRSLAVTKIPQAVRLSHPTSRANLIRPPTDTNDAWGGATDQATVKRNAHDIHNRVQNGRRWDITRGRTKRILSLPWLSKRHVRNDHVKGCMRYDRLSYHHSPLWRRHHPKANVELGALRGRREICLQWKCKFQRQNHRLLDQLWCA